MKRISIVIVVLFAAFLFAPQQMTAQKKAKVDKRAGFKEVPYFQTHLLDKDKFITGHDFIKIVQDMEFWDMEEQTIKYVLAGNMPSVLKNFRKILYKRDGHKIEIWVLPDYISIGTDEDYVRMPMGPLAAQKVADSLYCSLPTTLLSDIINEASEGRIDIFPFRPVGYRNTRPLCFEDSNNAINALIKAHGLHFGQFISGEKKDVVLTTRFEQEPQYDHHVAIYGWFHPDGKITQPLYIRHVNFYSDYSHGIRMIFRTIKIDGKEYDLKAVLEDPVLFHLVSKEDVPFKNASYLGK